MQEKHVSYGAYFKNGDYKYWLNDVNDTWVFLPSNKDGEGEFFEDYIELRNILYSFGNADIVIVKRVEETKIEYEDFVTLVLRENNVSRKTKYNKKSK